MNLAAFGGGCKDLGLPQRQMGDPGNFGLEEIHNLSHAALETACRGSGQKQGDQLGDCCKHPEASLGTEVLRRPGILVEPRIS